MSNRTLLGMSLQRALLGEISPRLRGVEVEAGDRHADIGFYFDGPVSNRDREAMSAVETEVMADMPAEYRVRSKLIQLDVPNLLPREGFWVYRRRED